jgi:hypothetical protein
VASGSKTTVRFGVRGSDAVVLVIVRSPDAKLVDVRTMSQSDFDRSGEIV